MPSATMTKYYQRARKADVGCVVGESALSAWRAAKILRKWRALEWVGAVRLHVEEDSDFEASPDNCDCESPECSAKIGPAYGVVGQYRTDWAERDTWHIHDGADQVWAHADSCWGHTGYDNPGDWRENAYVLDIMAETIDQFKAAWQAHLQRQRDIKAGRCPRCHGSGRV